MNEIAKIGKWERSFSAAAEDAARLEAARAWGRAGGRAGRGVRKRLSLEEKRARADRMVVARGVAVERRGAEEPRAGDATLLGPAAVGQQTCQARVK